MYIHGFFKHNVLPSSHWDVRLPGCPRFVKANKLHLYDKQTKSMHTLSLCYPQEKQSWENFALQGGSGWECLCIQNRIKLLSIIVDNLGLSITDKFI